MKRMLVVGAGGFGRAVAEAILARGDCVVAGFVDDRFPDVPPIWDIPVLGSTADLPALCARADAAVVAIGDNGRRLECSRRVHAVGLEPASVVHPRAIVSPSASLGTGVIVMAGAIVGTLATLEDGVLVNAGAVLDHDVRIGRFAHVGVGASVGGGARLSALAWLRQGAVLAPGQRLEAADGD